jgi:hypothetical protein
MGDDVNGFRPHRDGTAAVLHRQGAEGPKEKESEEDLWIIVSVRKKSTIP